MKTLTLLLFSSISVGAFVVALHPPVVKSDFTSSTAIRDMNGKAVALDAPARKVIIFSPHLWDFLTIDQGTNHVLGVADFQKEVMAEGLLGQVFPGSRAIPDVLTESHTAVPGDPEEILYLRPDAVFTWGWFSDSLHEVNLPVVEMTYNQKKSPEENSILSWHVIADVGDRHGRDEELVSRYFKKRDEIRQEVASLKSSEVPTTAFMEINGLDSMFVSVNRSSNAIALQMAGGKYVTPDSPRGATDAEELLRLDPDVIILGCCLGKRDSPQFFYGNAAFQNLSAVKNRRIYKEPIGGSRMDGLVEDPLLVRWLAEVLHPREMPPTFRSELRTTYQEVYHYMLSDDDIDKTIFLKENLSSANYSRFER